MGFYSLKEYCQKSNQKKYTAIKITISYLSLSKKEQKLNAKNILLYLILHDE